MNHAELKEGTESHFYGFDLIFPKNLQPLMEELSEKLGNIFGNMIRAKGTTLHVKYNPKWALPNKSPYWENPLLELLKILKDLGIRNVPAFQKFSVENIHVTHEEIIQHIESVNADCLHVTGMDIFLGRDVRKLQTQNKLENDAKARAMTKAREEYCQKLLSDTERWLTENSEAILSSYERIRKLREHNNEFVSVERVDCEPGRRIEVRVGDFRGHLLFENGIGILELKSDMQDGFTVKYQLKSIQITRIDQVLGLQGIIVACIGDNFSLAKEEFSSIQVYMLRKDIQVEE